MEDTWKVTSLSMPLQSKYKLLNNLSKQSLILWILYKDYRCFNVGATQYLTVLTERWLKIFQYVDGFYELLQTIDRSAISSPWQPMTSVLPISPPTYRDETVLLVSGPGFVDLLLFNASTLEFKPTKSSCSQLELDKFRDLNQLPLTFHTDSKSLCFT